MKNSLFLTFFASLLINAIAFSQNITDAKGLKQGSWGKKDEMGHLKYEGQFKDNQPYGIFKYYYNNGNKKAVSTYSDGGRKTHTIMYTSEGIIEAEGNFYNQQKDSIWVYYDATGKLILSKESYKNNLRDGAFVNYFADGKVLEISNYTNGKKNGLWKVFYNDGKPKINGKYVSGELDSSYNVYHITGTKKIEGQYKKATREGNWFFYNDNGEIGKQEMYTNGKLIKTIYHNGTFKNYYSDDVIKEEFTYLKGKKNGMYVEYFNNGKLVKKQKTNDDGTVETIEVLEGQTIKSKGEYKNDIKVGRFVYYNENGKLEKEEKFPQ